MQAMIDTLSRIHFAYTLVFLESVLCSCFPKRKKAILRLIGSTALLLVIAFLLLEDWRSSPDMFAAELIVRNYSAKLLISVLTILQMMFCYKIRPWDALFAFAIAGVTQDFPYMLTEILWNVLFLTLGYLPEGGIALAMDLTVMFLFGGIIYNKYARKGWPRNSVGNRTTVLAIFVIVYVSEILRLMILTRGSFPRNSYDSLLLSLHFLMQNLVAFYMVFNVIWRKNVESEKMLLETMVKERSVQFQRSKQLVKTLNERSHELKRQIGDLKHHAMNQGTVIQELEALIQPYEAAVHTENSTLSTVLTEKSLICQQHKIPFTCLIDDKNIDFIRDLDIYTLFGCLLDNGIEATKNLPPEKQHLKLVVQQKAGFLSIHEENSFAGSLRINHGYPVGSEDGDGYHGYGVFSIRTIVEQYGGTISITPQNGLFVMNILLPIPQNAE